MTRFLVRRIVMVASVLAALAAIAAAVLDSGAGPIRMIAACGLVGSLVALVCAVILGKEEAALTASPEHLAEDRMAAVRHLVLQQEFAKLQSSHEQVLAELKSGAANTSPDVQAAAGREAAIEAERDAALAEATRLRDEVQRSAAVAKQASVELSALRENTSASSDELRRAVAERDEARATVESERRRADAAAANAAPLAQRAKELESKLAALEEARNRLAEDGKSARSAKEAAAAARDAALARISAQEKEIAALRGEDERLRKAMRDAAASAAAAAPLTNGNASALDAARARIETLTAESAASAQRVAAAQQAIAQLQKERDTLSGELTRQRAEAARPRPDSGDAKRLAEEIAVLRARAEHAEAAVRATLEELGVDPMKAQLDAASVQSAIMPLTLFALGEDTPGWRPNAEGETLVAALIDLRRQADDRLRQLQNAQSSLDRVRRSA